MTRASDINDAAAEWLIRLDQASPEIWEAFNAWTDADPRHRAAFIRLRHAWTRVDLLKHMRPENGSIDPDLLARRKVRPATLAARGLHPLAGTPRRRPGEIAMPERRQVLAAAAAVVVAGFVALLAAHRATPTAYQTSIGGRERIMLTDGSTVDLNTNTELRTNITGSRRDIVLTRGEAWFHVAHDPSRPFYVTAGGTVVRAVGTQFSVRIRDPEHVDVMVAEGRVAVGAPGAPTNFDDPWLLAAAPKVSAGEAASVRRNTVAVRSVLQKDITRKLAWTAGWLSFQGDTLDEAVEEFNRYNQRQVTIADPNIVQLQVGGTFRATDPESFIAALRSLGIREQLGNNNGEFRLIAGERPPK